MLLVFVTIVLQKTTHSVQSDCLFDKTGAEVSQILIIKDILIMDAVIDDDRVDNGFFSSIIGALR